MSSRRKQQKPRPNWHDPACPCGQQALRCPGGWPDAKVIRDVVDLDALASRLLERVTANDVFELMQRIPKTFRQLMLRDIGLTTVSSINRGMAGQVLARIRRDAHPAGSRLLNMLTDPVTALLDSRLTAEEWATVTGDDAHSASMTLIGHKPVAVLLSTAAQITPALRAAGLVSAIAAETAAAAVALALLAADDDTCAQAHAELATEYPKLPAVPAQPLEQLDPAGRARRVLPTERLDRVDLDDIDQLMIELETYCAEFPTQPIQEPGYGNEDHVMSAEDDGLDELLATAASDPHYRGAARERLLGDIRDALDGWDDVIGSARAIHAAVSAGQLWDSDQLNELTEFEQSVSTVADRAGTMLGSPVEPTRPGLSAAAETLRDEARSSLRWLYAVARLEAPPVVAGAAEAARQLARQALDQPPATGDRTLDGLRALHTIVVSGMRRGTGQDIDSDELTVADQTVRDTLPPVVPLIVPALCGSVTIPIEGTQDAASGDTASIPSESKADDHGGLPGDELRDTPREDQSAERDEDQPGIPSAAPAGMIDESADEDAALAQLLGGGAARTLSALTGARRRTGSAYGATAHPGGHTLADAKPRETGTITGETDAKRAGQDDGKQQSGQREQIIELLPGLLDTGRYGLAADMVEACGEPAASVAARRLVAYATALRHPTGEIASAFARTAAAISRDELSGDRAGRLLAWAAAVRISVLSPSAGPIALLLNLAADVAGSEALTEIGQALVDASRCGVVVLPEAVGAVGSLAAQESLAADLAQEAADLLTAATTRMVKYVPANSVIQAWMSSTGPLGTLLATVAGNDPDAAATVRDSVVYLRDRGDREIDETFAATRRNGSKKKIIARVRGTLNARWDEAVEIASRWAEAAERAADMSASLRAGAWQAAPLHNLRTRLAAVRHAALAWLTTDAPADGDPGDAQLDAARRVASALLTETIAICDGQAPTGDEPPAAYAAHAELLAADLRLQARTLLPDNGLTPECLPALTAIAAAAPATLVEVYARRAAQGDHELTVVLIAGIRAQDPDIARMLDGKRTAAVIDDAINIAERLRRISAEIDAQRMAGGLDDGPWSSLSSRALALDPTTRTDFGRIRAEVQRIRAELAEHNRRKIDQTVARINARAADSVAVAEAADTLLEFARSGQIASAEEYLDQVSASGQLPADTTRIDHLRQFLPAVPDLYAAHTDLNKHLHAALCGAEPSPAVQELAAAAGTDLATLAETRRNAGVRALDMWQALARGNRGAPVDATGALRAVLSQAGLEFTGSGIETPPGPGRTPPAGRRWVRLTGVTGTGSALVPTLGSAISPDGATLRVLVVNSAPTPATVLEWMSAEAADHTVLALWLDKPLTTADRRAIADAARGRATPPVLFLDAAALGYLICQTEPRRGTFAATALPLSAVSPFRDTPGNTPPEMFYGRTEEIAAVLDLSGPSVLYGGRQLGKSALLRAAAARFEASGRQRHAVERDIFTVGREDERDPSRLWDLLWPRLAERGIVSPTPPPGELADAMHDQILAWLAKDGSRALLVLLDEADAFLDADAAGNRFTHVDRCRRIMLDSSRRAKFVFAGLHRTARFESLPNQPLSHLGQPVSVGPLRPQHAYDLLTQPLAAMGFRFADTNAGPARVLALANNMPALLQLFGRALIAHLTARPVDRDGPPSLITDDDIDAVFSNTDLREAFRQKYQLTINLDHRYMVIAYAVAEAAHDRGIDASLTLSELFDACRQAWPGGFAAMAADDFRSLVTECVDLSVLAEDDGRFRVRTPTVLRLLGTEEQVLDVLYTRTAGMSVPSASDAASYRRPLGPARSPFTERQLGQLFSAGRRVLVVTGSDALGVRTAVTALEKAHTDAVVPIDKIRRCHTLTADGIRRDVGKLTGNREMLIADATALPVAALREFLTAANTALESRDRQITVVVVAGPRNAPGWIGWLDRLDRLELGRVDAPGLRLWCDEANLPFHDDESVARLHAATGGWPLVVTHAARMCGTDRPVATATRVLDKTAEWLDGPGARELTSQSGLASGVLAQVFASIAALTSNAGEDLETLVQLLELDDEIDRDEVFRVGFTGLTQVVTALGALGCLVTDTAGRLRAEPVLAAAVQAAAAPTAPTGGSR